MPQNRQIWGVEDSALGTQRTDRIVRPTFNTGWLGQRLCDAPRIAGLGRRGLRPRHALRALGALSRFSNESWVLNRPSSRTAVRSGVRRAWPSGYCSIAACLTNTGWLGRGFAMPQSRSLGRRRLRPRHAPSSRCAIAIFQRIVGTQARPSSRAAMRSGVRRAWPSGYFPIAACLTNTGWLGQRLCDAPEQRRIMQVPAYVVGGL